jgi:Ca2+-binding RTX toxin-like protein
MRPGRGAIFVVCLTIAAVSLNSATTTGTADSGPCDQAPAAGAIVLTPGPDTYTAGAGSEIIYAEEGDDVIVGGSGNDLICGGPGQDSLSGGGGNDSIGGGADFDFVDFRTAPGPDGVVSDLGKGVAHGEGEDVLTDLEAVIGSRFSDMLSGDGGVNTLIGFEGSDRIDGGDGLDTASYVLDRGPVSVSLSADVATDGGGLLDRLMGIESVAGSTNADTLIGDDESNIFEGGPGDDRVSGRGGGDTVDGGSGEDAAYGGQGLDFASFASETSGVGVRADLAEGQATIGPDNDRLVGFEGLLGSAYGDVLVGDALDNQLAGLNGSDRLDGAGGVDVAQFGALLGDDRAPDIAIAGPATVDLGSGRGRSGGDVGQVDLLYRIEGATGSIYDDELSGSDTPNLLLGLDGDDELSGGRADDVVDGGPGRDRVRGGPGDADSTQYAFDQGIDSGIRADLAAGTVEVGSELGSVSELVRGIEILFGSPFADRLKGGPGPDVLRGSGGDDRIEGSGGIDVLLGGGGEDELHGGENRDHCLPSGPQDVEPQILGGCESTRLPPEWVAEMSAATLLLTVDLRGCRNRPPGHGRCKKGGGKLHRPVRQG